jgi:hypothetical protein
VVYLFEEKQMESKNEGAVRKVTDATSPIRVTRQNALAGYQTLFFNANCIAPCIKK